MAPQTYCAHTIKSGAFCQDYLLGRNKKYGKIWKRKNGYQKPRSSKRCLANPSLYRYVKPVLRQKFARKVGPEIAPEIIVKSIKFGLIQQLAKN